jgi:hypothetical protein
MINRLQRSILIVLVVLLCAGGLAGQKKPRPDLHARTKANGGRLMWRYKPRQTVVYPTIKELANSSHLVIIGRTLGHRSKLTRDGKFITQDFLVRVQEALKGDVPNGSSILVSLPGGSHKFPDGSHIYVLPAGYKQVVDGASYVFFLKHKKRAEFKGYPLVSETQGLFALKDGKVELAYEAPSDPIAVRYQGADAVSFLKHLHALTTRVKTR